MELGTDDQATRELTADLMHSSFQAVCIDQGVTGLAAKRTETDGELFHDQSAVTVAPETRVQLRPSSLWSNLRQAS